MNKEISSIPQIDLNEISARRVMLDVIIALLPATVVGILLFGLKALWIVLTCVACAVASEFLFNICVHKKQTIGDLSAVVTGLLLALSLSINVPLWQCAVGAVFAIVVVKCIFGGLGKNIVNPAVTARVFMLLAFGSVTAAVRIAPIFDLGFMGQAVPEIVSGATPLALLDKGSVMAAKEAPSVLQLFVGAYGGTIGETCSIALLIGFAYLVIRKVIKWYVPVSYIATVFACYFLFGGFNAVFALQHVLAGGLIFGAVFMVTDYVTTPTTNTGRVIFCVCAGLLTYAIRQFGSFTEGVSVSILTMNLITPFISDWTKKKTPGGVEK